MAGGGGVGGIFINHRSGEHATAVEALHRELARHFGERQVFLDRPSMHPGDRYPDELRRRVLASDVLLVVIHRTWLAELREPEAPDRDWVREEIEIAIRAGRPIVPVLLGDAASLPPPGALPCSIRELAHRQAHRIRAGHFGIDVERLTAGLERHVAPTWRPPEPPAPAGPRRPGRWAAIGSAMLAAALLAAPSAILLSQDGPVDPEPVADLVVLAVYSILFMVAPLMGYGLSYLVRARLLWLDREVQAWSPARFRQFTVPILALWLMFGAALAVPGERWRVMLPVTLGVSVAFMAYVLYQSARAEQREEDELRDWPQPVPSPLRGAADFRRAVARIRARVAGWSRPLTREQRDKACWVLDQLETAAASLREHAERPRSRWLADERPRWLLGYTVWVAGTAGLLLGAATALVGSGVSRPLPYLALAGLATIMALACLGTLELGYRYQRWNRTVLADETRGQLAELSGRLSVDASGGRDETTIRS